MSDATDAARYRWLRSRVSSAEVQRLTGRRALTFDDIDRAVDAGMAVEPRELSRLHSEWCARLGQSPDEIPFEKRK